MQVFPEERFRLGGDPTAIGASADIWARFAGEADSTAADLRALDADDFQGDEADTYRDRINTDLPPYLDTTSQAWTAVGGALRSYATTLADLQTRMSGLRSTGYAQWQAATAAQQQASAAAQTDAAHAADRQTAADALKPGQKLPADTYQPAAAGARSTATSATAAYTGTVTAADQLRTQHAQAVNACADAIDRATALRFADPPSWLGHLWENACDWVADHIDILQTLSAVLKQISSIAGMLAMIPILAPIAGPVALGAGMLATGIDAGIKITTGQGDWTDIGIGALGFVPGARAAMVAQVVDTGYTGYQVVTGEADLTDLAFAMAGNAAASKFGNALAKRGNSLPATKVDVVPMHGRSTRKQRPDPNETAWREAVPAQTQTWSGHDVRYSETATAIGNDVNTIQNFKRSRGVDGTHEVIIHGTVDGEFQLQRSGSHIIHPQQVADLIRSNPHYDGRSITLVTCHGSNGQAQALADILGVEVYSSPHKVYIERASGRMAEEVNGAWNVQTDRGTPARPVRTGGPGGTV